MPTITHIEKPSAVITQSTNTTAARDKAIAALMGGTGNNQATPAQDPSNMSIEETQGLNKRQNDTIETSATDVPSEATKPATEEEPISSQYAVLARKEKALRAKAVTQDQQFKLRESAIATKEAELASKATQDLSNYISKDKLKQNAISVLAELGVSYDDLSAQALAAQSPDAQLIRQMREELSAELRQVREEQAKTRETFEQQQTQAYQQALNQISTEAKQLVNTDPQFETIKAANAVKDVVDLIERTFKEDGTLLTVEEAAQAVEDYLVEEAIKFSKVKKIQEKLKLTAATTPTPQSQQQTMKTLTNSVSSTRPLSARERALLAFRNELNK